MKRQSFHLFQVAIVQFSSKLKLLKNLGGGQSLRVINSRRRNKSCESDTRLESGQIARENECRDADEKRVNFHTFSLWR